MLNTAQRAAITVGLRAFEMHLHDPRRGGVGCAVSCAPLLWLFLAGCAVTVLSGTRAGALTAEEGRSFFAASLTWCCAIVVAARLVRARADRRDHG